MSTASKRDPYVRGSFESTASYWAILNFSTEVLPILKTISTESIQIKEGKLRRIIFKDDKLAGAQKFVEDFRLVEEAQTVGR